MNRTKQRKLRRYRPPIEPVPWRRWDHLRAVGRRIAYEVRVRKTWWTYRVRRRFWDSRVFFANLRAPK